MTADDRTADDRDAGDPPLILTDAPDAQARAAIGKGLDAFNAEQAGHWDRRPLAVLVRDPDTDEVVGGLIGRTALGLLFIDVFFLPETLRGRGIGSRMVRLAEEEAMRRGCRSAVLYTISFQAPDFYERLGYRVFGRVSCDPPGHARIFMSKELAGPDRRPSRNSASH
jgi:ribosomal protein S18 acetylase RimI-like enzyme